MLTKGARREIHRAPANFRNVIAGSTTLGNFAHPANSLPTSVALGDYIEPGILSLHLQSGDAAMEPLPKGANFVRAKTLWEIGLHLAGNPATPYGGNRDMVITVGSGAGAAFRPWLRLATGSAILAEQVAAGDGIDLAFVNPSALLTQAYRGVGLFRAPLPLRIVAVYPSWDRFVFMVHPRTGNRSLADIKAKRYPLRVSVREDPPTPRWC
jgi:hypothetical protein